MDETTLQLQRCYLLIESLQDNINTAKKILNNNNIDLDVKLFQDILDEAKTQVPPDQKRVIKDEHIPAIVLLYIGSGGDLDMIKAEYLNYVKTPKLSSNNVLSKIFNDVMQKIRQGKLFNPSEEKSRLFNTFFSSFVSDVHANMDHGEDKKFKNNFEDSSEDVVYSDENITIRLADSRMKCIKYGEPHLCISWHGANNYYWRYRMGEMRNDELGMTTYFVTDKKNNNSYLIDSMGDDDGPADKYSYNPIHPNVDSDIKIKELIKKHPELDPAIQQGVFKFIMYGDLEHRYRYIESKITSITDDQLKTKEDYWMFIESGKKINEGEWESIPQGLLKDAIVKYISVGEHLYISPNLLDMIQPSDRNKYENNVLKILKNKFQAY